ncbi:hypothetical protein IID22_00950 [Patescibacteria group bacterium]|nr:hypothetical protein [Patescibacteria group bacterium]
MINQEVIIFGSVLIALAFGLLSIALVLIYVRLSKKYRNILEEKSKKEPGPEKDINAILEEAQAKGQKIIEDSHTRAQKIVAEAGSFSADTKQKMLVQLDKVSSEYRASYIGLIEDAKVKTGELIKTLGEDIKTEAHLEVEAMRDSLRREIEKAQAATKAAIDEAYAKVERDIEGYKKKRLTQLDSEIFEIIRLVSEEVLGKTLSTKEHEDTIIKSLEDAKKQNVF